MRQTMSVKKPFIDLGYRQRTHVIAAIKGERRRSAIRSRTCPRSSDFCVEAVGRDTSKASL